MKSKYQNLIDWTEQATQEEDSYGFLPSITRTLKMMIDSQEEPKETRIRIARGLDRLVTDNFSFAKSELGGTLLDFANDFVDGRLDDSL